MKLDIKRIRKEKGISQEELAEKSGVSRPTISNLENNPDAVTTTDTLQKIALALDVNVSDFLSTLKSSRLDFEEYINKKGRG